MSGIYACCVMEDYTGEMHESNFIGYDMHTNSYANDENRYSLDDLLKESMFSTTNKSKLRSLKPGAFLRMYRWSNTSSRGIFHLTQKQVDFELELDKLKCDISDVRKEIRALVPEKLHQREKDLAKIITKMSKERKDFYHVPKH